MLGDIYIKVQLIVYGKEVQSFGVNCRSMAYAKRVMEEYQDIVWDVLM